MSFWGPTKPRFPEFYRSAFRGALDYLTSMEQETLHSGGCEEGDRMSLDIPISCYSKSGPRSVASACDGKAVLNLTPKSPNQKLWGWGPGNCLLTSSQCDSRMPANV